jgi:hypothetical protein
MSMTHPQPCRCLLHRRIDKRQMESRRHAGYRQLANAILGPTAPRNDIELARALAEHASLIQSVSTFRHLGDPRAA